VDGVLNGQVLLPLRMQFSFYRFTKSPLSALPGMQRVALQWGSNTISAQKYPFRAAVRSKGKINKQ